MNKKTNILIIETEASISNGLEDKLNSLGLCSCFHATPEQRIDELDALRPDLVFLGPSVGKEASLRCIHRLKILNPAIPILISCSWKDASASGESSDAPFEGVHYLDFDSALEEILRTVDHALKRRAELELWPDLPMFIGQNKGIQAIMHKIRRVADKDITVLITGETGTGKEMIARSIHYHSPRHRGPLVKINCGSMPDELLESEVFGFQKGAFTGAHRDKPGRIELSHKGTLFIDEVGNLSLGVQAKFLQVLEDRVFSRLGGTDDKIIDTRIVAATNANLWEKVKEGSFREDLFYRLNVVHIEAPSLREKKDDILLLAHYFLDRYCFEFKREPLEIPDRIVALFLAYKWPGNVRELENVIRRAIIVRDWNFLVEELNLEEVEQDTGDFSLKDPDLLHLYWGNEKVESFFENGDFALKKISKAYVAEAERLAILKALRQTQWNRSKAAQTLQVSYKTLLNRIDEFELKP